MTFEKQKSEMSFRISDVPDVPDEPDASRCEPNCMKAPLPINALAASLRQKKKTSAAGTTRCFSCLGVIQ